MKKIMIILAAFGMLGFTPTMILAQDDDGDDSNTSKLTIIDNSRHSDDYKERLQQFKDKLSDRINEAKQRSLEEKCELVTEKVSGAVTKASQYHEQRATIYSAWREKLGTLSTRLMASNVDITNLELLLEEFDTQIATTAANVRTYLADLEGIDTESCQDDAVAFYEAMQSLRAARQLIIADHQESLKIIKEDIKVELLSIKSSLDVKIDSDGEE